MYFSNNYKYIVVSTVLFTKKNEVRQKLGNITQIRELLFGEQIEEYNRNFDQLKQKNQNLESNIQELSLNLERFKSDTEEHLIQLKTNILEEINTAINSLEKKLKYLSVNTYAEVTKIYQEIDTKTNTNFQKMELVADNLNFQLTKLKEEANQNRETQKKNLDNLKKQLSETIENNLSELTEAKVSRSDLAEVLFELCLKVKGQNFNTDEIGDDGNGINSDLLLSEDKS